MYRGLDREHDPGADRPCPKLGFGRSGFRATSDPQHDLAQHGSGSQSFVGSRSVRERKGGRNRNLEAGSLHRTVEPLKLANPVDAVVGDYANTPPRFRRGFDTVRVRHAPAGSDEVEERLLRRAACEDESGVKAARCEGARRLLDIIGLSIDGHFRPKATYESHARGTRG